MPNLVIQVIQSSTSSKLTASEQKQLKQATSDYKTFVEGEIDQLLKDTEGFSETLKSGNLEEAKKQYPLVRMAYERSEPIAESFGESDVKIDYRLVDYMDENKSEDGWSGVPPYRTYHVARQHDRGYSYLCRSIG